MARQKTVMAPPSRSHRQPHFRYTTSRNCHQPACDRPASCALTIGRIDPLPLANRSPARYRTAVGSFTDAVQICCPALYMLDDQDPNMPGYTGQVTLKGYRNMAGVGMPNGQRFIAALRKLG